MSLDVRAGTSPDAAQAVTAGNTAGIAGTTGLADIKQLLPHRYPMLLVDRVLELERGRRIVAEHAVAGGELCYRDVTSTEPLAYGYPWVLVLESWAQAAGILATSDQPNPDVRTGQVMLFGAVSGVEVGEAPPCPGEVLLHDVRLARAFGDAMVFEGQCRVGDRVVLRVARVVVAMRPATVLREPDPARSAAGTAAGTAAGSGHEVTRGAGT